MTAVNASASIVDGHGDHPGAWVVGQRIGQVVGYAGLAAFLVAAFGGTLPGQGGWLPFFLSFGLIAAGAKIYIWATYKDTVAGIKNDGTFQSGTKSRGPVGWFLGFVITGFYVLLYWRWDLKDYIGDPLTGAIGLLEPLSQLLRKSPADHWFLYGFLYTGAVLIMGLRMGYRYRHNRYQLIRTFSVGFFQLGFAFLLPGLLMAFQQPEFYFTYFWPLKPEYLYPDTAKWLSDSGSLGIFMLLWGAIMALIATPILTWYFGKRWYCSWVCGCGGLAETLGDPFRHLSDKSTKAWRFERWSIHTVLVVVVLGTALLWVNSATEGQTLGAASQGYTKWYGFLVGSVLSGVVGVGFYPIMGSRVWCRFFCPQAAILGILQRFFSRFRITTNGGQCISCGNCSTYCEMGIDVRRYAQKGENIVRASCVGCGICAAVCPRGVLKLESGPVGDRFDGADKPLTELIKSLKS
jgi:Pyruvate/2-oxoacid:ferredoxin oxidoreductase delta subunit